ncbi:LA_1612 family putative O-antigen biosynthesis protein [Leptospira yasudae]|nr:LA_1612 family putative O-antigen biosynthesis protein [Leptospira yasudae]
MRRIRNGIRGLLIFFLFSKKEWRFPRKSDLLFYDSIGYEVFESYISKYDPVVLSIRGETLNVPIFILSLIKGLIGKKGYIHTFIAYVKPKLILTFIDNDPNFYELKQIHPEALTMFVQNGFRGEIGDIFGYLTPKESYNVDYMLTLGPDIGEKYGRYIKGRNVPIGSFKNNKTLKQKRTDSIRNTILFISQYISPPKNVDDPFYTEADGSVYSWKQFYEAELVLLPFLRDYCLQKNLSVRVCGRSKKYDPEELDFYNAYFGDLNWSMTSHESVVSSYELIDSANLVVFVDSTLGYEALARGTKAAAFPVRCRSLKNDSYKFGWPGNFSDNGPYWTNNFDTIRFKQILDHLIEISDSNWNSELIGSQFERVMNFDPGNIRFTDLLRTILGNKNETN